jgi:YHS domain-containing protein
MQNASSISRLAILTITLLAGFFMTGSLFGQALNLDKNGVAIQGYDPVAFFTEKKPVKGKATLSSQSGGATYHFSSEANKKVFDAEPTKYIPQFGGFCAYGVAKGDKVKIEVDAFQIVDGRLLLQYDKKVRDLFTQDQKELLKKADANWPTVKDKK